MPFVLILWSAFFRRLLLLVVVVLGLLCLLVGLPVVHHQLFELIEIIEAQQHIQQLVIDLLSTRLQ